MKREREREKRAAFGVIQQALGTVASAARGPSAFFCMYYEVNI